MRSEELLKAFEDVDERFLGLVESEAKGKKYHKRGGVAWKIAGIAACLICAVGVLIVLGSADKTLASNWFGLRSLCLGHVAVEVNESSEPQDETRKEKPQDQQPETDPYAPPQYAQGTMITLAGYYDSAEAKAASEWQEFLDGYDQDHEILYAADKTWVSPEGFEEYFVYSDEMVEKLQEIIDKYDLKLHRNFEAVYQNEGVEAKLGYKFWDDRCELLSCYTYADGAFQIDADYHATGDRTYGYQLRRNVKGVFDEVCLNIGFVDDYEEWSYVTKDGAEVLLALSRYKGLVFGDYDSCCIAINVLDGTEGGLTKEDLEMIADSHHVSLMQ